MGVLARSAALAACALALAPRAARAGSIDWLVLQPELGVAYSNVLALSNQQLFPSSSSPTVPTVTETKGFGSHFGATAGMRFGPLGAGLRADLSRYSQFDIGTVGAQVQLRLPIPLVQPYAQLGFGYAWLGAIDQSVVQSCSMSSAGCPRIRGWSLSAGAGVDVWLGSMITVGGGLDLYLLNLTRSGSFTMVNIQEEGDSVGLQVAASARAALHF